MAEPEYPARGLQQWADPLKRYIDGTVDVALGEVADEINDSESEIARALSASIASHITLLPLVDFLDPGQALPNDGIADASPVIQRALNHARGLARASTNPYVRYVVGIPAGRYRLNATLNPCGANEQADRIGIRGAGRGETVLLPHGNNSGIEPWMSFTTYPRHQFPRSLNCYYGHFTIDLINATHPDPTEASFKGFKGSGWVDCYWESVEVLHSPATAFGNDYPVRCVMYDCHVRTTGEGINGAIANPTPISAAKSKSGFGIGFGVLEDESLTLINCSATDCHRGGFFFEMQHLHGTLRGAVIQMIGCTSWGNKIGITDVATSGIHAINCQITDNTYAGLFTGATPFTPDIAGRDGTLQGCQILRNGTGIYSIGDVTSNYTPTSLVPVLGGYRVLDCRIEDNVNEGIIATRFETLEDGGLTIRGNQFRGNGKADIRLVSAVDPLRDLVIEGNHFAGDGEGAAIELLVPMNAPRVGRNTFVGYDEAVVVHPAEPVTVPMIDGNTFRSVDTPMVGVERLDQTYVTGNRVLDATDDPDTAERLYRQSFTGGTGTEWPVEGDGWAKVSSGVQPTWSRTASGLYPSAGTVGEKGMVYRTFADSGLYVEAAIQQPTAAPTTHQHTAVALGMQAASRAAVFAGINGTAAASGLSSYYAMWKIVGGTASLLWESSVPMTEGHSVALARESGSTMTHMFIDGVLVHSMDVPDVAASPRAGLYSTYISGGARRITEFRALPFVA